MTLTIKAGTLTREGDIGIVSINHPPVNALSQVVREGILGCVKAADADPAIKAIVFICEGRTFLAGADITEFGKPPTAPSLFEV
ncbi:MAG: enoyl-CoA hydratase-related protein, partial [Aquabacterium sp.]